MRKQPLVCLIYSFNPTLKKLQTSVSEEQNAPGLVLFWRAEPRRDVLSTKLSCNSNKPCSWAWQPESGNLQNALLSFRGFLHFSGSGALIAPRLNSGETRYERRYGRRGRDAINDEYDSPALFKALEKP